MENQLKQNMDKIISDLVTLAESKGVVTYDDINNALSLSRITPDEIEYIFNELTNKGVKIGEVELTASKTTFNDKINNALILDVSIIFLFKTCFSTSPVANCTDFEFVKESEDWF